MGKPIADRCRAIRVSPRRDQVAVLAMNRLEVLDSSGRRVAAATMPYILTFAWSHDGQEVWFTGSETNSATDRAIYALDVKGNVRLIARMPGAMTIYDVARDGSALITTGSGWSAVNAARVDGQPDLALDLLGRSDIAGMSADGKWLLTNETREVGRGAYLFSTDGKSPPIPYLGETGLAVSPDGASILVRTRGNPRELRLISRDAGPLRALALPPEHELTSGRLLWSRDGRRLFGWFQPQGQDSREARLYMQEGEGAWQPVTSSTVSGLFAVSRDGRAVAVRANDVVTIYFTDGRPEHRLDGEGGTPIHWSDDGQSIYFKSEVQFPSAVYRRHIATGRIDPWRTVGPADATGVSQVNQVFIAEGEQFYVYQYTRVLNDLFLARGLR
jgi:Tol biopolymer transport system component